VLTYLGYIRSKLFIRRGNGGVYAETFAVWMVLFIVLGLVLGLAVRYVIPVPLPPLLVSAVGSLLSLAALGWPVLRGIPWRTVREELGLTFGRRPEREMLLGPACYAMTLPLALVGFLIFFALTLIQQQLNAAAGDPMKPGESPSHPVILDVARAGWAEWIQIFFLVSVVAPVVEEVMFRGVLYRHLRELTGQSGLVLSVLASSAVVSFIFAVIHPQGLLTVPILMSLALGFTLMREWRGSLVPAMIAHGINNGVVLTLALFIFSG
jgi:membrane protease YdiL (CAAX protease family)